MTERRYYDKLETRDPEERERALMATLPQQVAHARRAAVYFAERLRDIEPRGVNSRKALALLPVTRKSQLIEIQRKALPFGGLNAAAPDQLQRIFMSPGPIYDPEGRRADYWRMARALFAAGFRSGGLIHNCFSYHLTPAAAMIESGAQALGCPVIPGGTGQTELQVKVIVDLQPQGYTGTPSFLRLILEKARELGADISCLKRALVSGEAFTPALRSVMVSYQLAAFQTYGTADVGNIAYETEARDGLVLDEGIILEIVRPGTSDPVPEGEVGEVVVTTLTADYPLVRFGTGDLSAILPGQSPCGRTNQRIRGWMGRADQTTKVKGMFVHPEQVAEILKRHQEVGRGRLVITHDGHNDIMTLKAEVPAGTDPGLALKLAESLAAITKLTGMVTLVPPKSLANDGKVIEDARKHE
ncbi:MAG TPA: phenylacetate--CoA ligase family protein [Stellaceae bacterium]|nr:phenylacetate--CoA ligase family protein [Stellaceae bacterium]